MTKAYVYLITNVVNDKKYVGFTAQTNPENRWNSHKSKGRHYIGKGNNHLCNAYKKYGLEKFTFQVLETFPTKQTALIWENYLIELYQTENPNFGYNKTPGGECPEVSIETRQKLSIAHLGKIQSEETKQRRSESLKGNTHGFSKGIKPHTTKLDKQDVSNILDLYFIEAVSVTEISKQFDVTSQAISAIVNNKNWKEIDRTCYEKYGKPNIVQVVSIKTRSKISNALTGKVVSSETLRKKSDSVNKRVAEGTWHGFKLGESSWNKGLTSSEETCKKHSESKAKLYKGEGNPAAKLQENDVKTILTLYFIENITITEISKQYPVTLQAIYRIVHGLSWKCIDRTPYT